MKKGRKEGRNIQGKKEGRGETGLRLVHAAVPKEGRKENEGRKRKEER